MNQFVYYPLLFTTVTGVVILTAHSVRASLFTQKLDIVTNNSLIALEFTLPGDSAPKTSIGEGVRGQVQFSLPGDTPAPRSTVAGGTRGDVEFSLPGGTPAPRSTVAGGTRGDVEFSLPGDTPAPRSTVAGGTRGDVEFSLPGDTPAPRSTVAGGTRGDVEFSLPGGTPAPRSTVAGGTRGDVPRLTALVPPNKYGLTTSARPTIYVYLPPIKAQEVFFSLQDEEGNPHYHTLLKVPPHGGVISITLPKEAPALEMGKNYLWYFAPIESGGFLRPDNYAVIGWVKLVKVNFNEQELAVSPIKLATEYAKAGVWYDTLKVLVKAQLDAPNNKNLAAEWHDLLKQVGLGAIASQQLTE